MFLKKCLIAAATALVLSGGVYGYAASHPLEVRLDEAHVRHSLEAHFPISKDLIMGVAGVRVNVADVDLHSASGRGIVLLTGQLEAAGKVFDGEVRISFGLDYDAHTGQLFLVQPQVESCDFKGVSPLISNALTKYFLPMVESQLERIAIYQLHEDASLQQNLLRKTLRQLQIQDGKVVLSLGI